MRMVYGVVCIIVTRTSRGRDSERALAHVVGKSVKARARARAQHIT